MKLLLSIALALVATNPIEAQCDYNFCGGGVTNPTTIITSPGGTQAPCALIQTGINLGQVSAEQCLGLPEIEKTCCPADGSTGGDSGATTQTCFVCDGDVTFNEEKTWRGEKICASFDTSLAALPSGTVCDAAKGAANLNLNMPSFCECEGAVAPNLCSVCGDNQDVNMDAIVPDTNGQITCSAGVDYVKHLKNEAACSVFVTDSVKATCCAEKSGALGLALSSFATVLMVVGLAVAI
ncbi:unnamed protein product [Cylindrotheca closterium]|uniref:Uncharacterized protein n=1 Tax=Cylindrotheca closterium TaxID=2856 RepID=A0AAD2CJ03_9STRA|nr:unnamed protein product [Cylindrotheca closterium]